MPEVRLIEQHATREFFDEMTPGVHEIGGDAVTLVGIREEGDKVPFTIVSEPGVTERWDADQAAKVATGAYRYLPCPEELSIVGHIGKRYILRYVNSRHAGTTIHGLFGGLFG